jgi:hypothetical protein
MSSQQRSDAIDSRWFHALDGLRVRVVRGRFTGDVGEVTGADSMGIHIVTDDIPDHPIGIFWGEWEPEHAIAETGKQPSDA